MFYKAVLVVFLSLVSCAFAQAQALPSRPLQVSLVNPYQLSSEQLSQVSAWVSAMRKWHKYDAQWFNKMPIANNGVPARRKQMPEAPGWLAGYCRDYGFGDSNSELAEACGDLASLSFDPVAEEIQKKIQQQRQNGEKPVHDWFLSRLHFDGLWTESAVGNGPRIYGLIGTHVSLVDMGRVQMYGPPGVLWIRLRDAYGNIDNKLGYTWGMSVRLGNFRIPGSGSSGKNATVYINLVKCWVSGFNSFGSYSNNGLDMVGFSVTPRRRK